ncbi:MAG: hypothetical protein IJI54_03650, partial [Kiritimatiellae bacterium]|nr:hypothetical protein [Kiritimatiellia bacterium]
LPEALLHQRDKQRTGAGQHLSHRSFNLSAANHYDCRKPRSCDLGFLQFAVVPNFFFSPRNYAAFLNQRAVARRKGKLFQTSCFPSLEDVVVNYTDAP